MPGFLRFSAIVLCLVMVAGCGFRPLYDRGTADQPGITAQLSTISVQRIAEREGQILRNLLENRLAPRGPSAQTVYKLDATISFSESGLGTSITEETSRALMIATANFTFSSVTSESEILAKPLKFSLSARVGYSIADSLYATQIAKEDAQERALVVIADDAKIHLAAILLGLEAAESEQRESEQEN